MKILENSKFRKIWGMGVEEVEIIRQLNKVII